MLTPLLAVVAAIAVLLARIQRIARPRCAIRLSASKVAQHGVGNVEALLDSLPMFIETLGVGWQLGRVVGQFARARSGRSFWA